MIDLDPASTVSAVASGVVAVAAALRPPPGVAASRWRVRVATMVARTEGELARPRLKKAARARLTSLRASLVEELDRLDKAADAALDDV